MVAAAQPLAVESAVRVLREGGSAVDAALAANAVLAVVEPTSCGLGGDLFALIWEPSQRRLQGLDASGRAPLALTRERVRADEEGAIPLRSPASWTVPGCVAGWFALHARHGRLPVDRLLADAIRIAREGFPVSEVVASAWSLGARAHSETPGFAEVFLRRGRAPGEGEVFRNPSLARTLSELVEAGPDGFYRGRVADALVGFSEDHGGFLSLGDLAAARADWVEPLSVGYRGHELWELPPAGQGLAALQLLGIAAACGLPEEGRSSPDWWHVLVEAKKLAWADRAALIADPSFEELPVERLVSPEHLAARAALVDGSRAATEIPASERRLDGGDTTYLAVADDEGMMVSWIQSNYTGFGSGHAVPELGFGLQNRGALFSLDPSHPNRLEPGKRPFHTIIPAFVTRGGEPWLAFGVMGGDMQPQGHVQVLLNLVDEGMSLQEAGDAPRFHHSGPVEPTGRRRADGGDLHLEPEVPEEIASELARRGHRVGDSPWVYGGYQAVARDPETGCLFGATESRKDGCALGW